MRKIVFVLLSILFISSCNKDSKQDWSGMEYFDFEITGHVSDMDGNPLTGISVSASGSSVQTKSDGSYKLEGRGGTQTIVVVSFADIDGIENGGLYFGATRSIKLDYIKGKHGPFLGLYGKSGVDAALMSGRAPTPDFGESLQ